MSEFEENKANAEAKATNPVPNNNTNNDTEVTVYEGVESASSQSTREQISQLRTLQTRTRAQPTEMKGYPDSLTCVHSLFGWLCFRQNDLALLLTFACISH